MWVPLIGPQLHGWLDDLVAMLYFAGALVLGLSGTALVIACAGGVTHFTLTRLTDYPQGTWKLIPFRGHAFVELAEGVAVLAGTLLLLASAPLPVRAFLALMGATQFVAFAFSDYRQI